MDKRARNIAIMLLGIIIILFTIEKLTPKPINWSMSYTSGDKIPFGSYVLYDQLDDMFPNSEIRQVNVDPMSFLKRHKNEKNSNYIFINDHLYFDEFEAEALMEFASRGNKVFVASTYAYDELADTLKLETGYGHSSDTVRVRLVNENFKDRSYVYLKGSEYKYFNHYDTLNVKVLGEALPLEPYKGFIKEFLGTEDEPDTNEELEEILEESSNDDEEIDIDEVINLNTRIPQVNFVETRVGDGAIYYNLNPIAFTNYYMLQDGKNNYVSESLSYLNDGPIYFDDYGKSGRKVIQSPMRYVLSQPTLTWAYWIATLCVLLYFFFAGKREQRIIPVVKPLSNATLDFTKTIGHMYYQSGEVSNIIDKKINYFLEKLRSRYFVDTQTLDDVFIKRLITKSGKSSNLTEDVILYINKMRSRNVHTNLELKELNQRIEAFLKE